MATLLIAPAGGGKTARLHAALHALRQRDALARAWVLVSTERQISDFRRRFLNSTLNAAPGAVFNVEYFSFYTLYRRILAIARQPGRTLTPTAQAALVRALLHNRLRDLPVFGGIVDTPGFARAAVELIDELKQHRILPDQFAAAQTTPRGRALASIYSAYMALLQEQGGLIDREGEGWLALEAVERANDDTARRYAPDLLLVDGYDQFNPLQVALLAALDRQAGEMWITLSHANTERFAQTRAALERAFGDRLHVDAWSGDEPPRPTRFWIEAPSIPDECAAVMRAVKRRLLSGEPPDSVCIAVRDWARYADPLRTAAQRFGVPVAVHYAPAPADSPAVAALIGAISLHRDGWLRRPVLDALRSPYLRLSGLNAAAVEQIDLLSRAGLVIGGRDEWRAALLETHVSEDEREDDPELFAGVDRAALWVALARAFDALTPPPTGDMAAYIGWVEGLIGHDAAEDEQDERRGMLGVLEAARDQDDADAAARDLAGLHRLRIVMRGLLMTDQLAAHLNLPVIHTADSFLDTLTAALGRQPIARAVGRDGRVLLTLASDARGLPHAHVYIVGLAEGVFPAPVSEDPLLLDSERADLRRAGIPLPNAADRADDPGLFASIAGTARVTLTFSRPTVKNGELWTPSALWIASQPDPARTTRQAIGAPPGMDDAAAPHEAALAWAARIRRGEAVRAGWLGVQHPAFTRHIMRVIAVERGRMARVPHDPYSGVLADAALIAQARREVDTRTWSASALNDYGQCPFRYFAHRILGLDAVPPPEQGMDVRQRGTLMHDILERTYRALHGVTIAPEHLDHALALLETHLAERLPGAPERLGFRRSAVWAGEQTAIRRILRQVVTRDFSDAAPPAPLTTDARTPLEVERAFGGRDAPLTLTLDDGVRIRVRGVIDRIDRSGGGLIIIDYKSGSTKIDSVEITSGRNVQMLVYLEAARALYPDALIGGLFWHMPNSRASGLLDLRADEAKTILMRGRARLARHIRAMRAGDFRSRPNKLTGGKCSAHCDFYQLCRPAHILREKE
jgi:ATP-dependent helicase/DNAse subunit B